RYSTASLANPTKQKGKDRYTTRRPCAKFRHTPVGIFNFADGTRFTAGNHAQQNSPFRHLLKPKAGGIAFVLDAMGEQLETIINVTIHYPGGQPGYWDLLCGNVREEVVHFEEIKIPQQFLGKNYDQDGVYRLAFQQRINMHCEEKDLLLDSLHAQSPAQHA
ncbi:acyltransferase, partial [Pseudomonas syringae]